MAAKPPAIGLPWPERVAWGCTPGGGLFPGNGLVAEGQPWGSTAPNLTASIQAAQAGGSQPSGGPRPTPHLSPSWVWLWKVSSGEEDCTVPWLPVLITGMELVGQGAIEEEPEFLCCRGTPSKWLLHGKTCPRPRAPCTYSWTA